MGVNERLARHALMDRRTFIQRAGLAALVAGGVSPLLAACGSPDRSASPDPTTAPAPTLPPFDPDRPYWMQGGFAPVRDEVEAFDLTVRGALPAALSGLYVRNGSNPAAGDSSHWFLGDGMVHGVRLEGGRAAWYRNRYLDTPLYRDRSGLIGGGGGPPGGARNQSNVSVFEHAGRLLSSGELGLPYELSTDDLATIGPHDFDGRLETSMTAHPKVDPATGHLHFFGYGFVPPYLTYHVADGTGALVHSTEIEVAGPTMIHDFAITDRDVVFWELPVVFDMERALAAVRGEGTGGMPFRWDESYGARIGVLPIGADGSAIRWVEIPPCYVFHGVNAFREGTDVVVDVCRMPAMFVEGLDVGSAVPHRWRIGTGGDDLAFRDEGPAGESMDLPSIDRRRTGLPNRHAWYLLVGPEADWPAEFQGLVRTDASTGAVDRYEPGPGVRVNEGTFVPGSPDAAEGEGWLLSYAWNRARDASDLLVLEALDLAAGPVASVELPARVPYGFHGAWVADPI
jgi:carotenoid cleavage dioxygenase